MIGPARVPKEVPAVSPARLAANRANAARSTGPRTADGRARSARNATTHGLLAHQLVLPGEDPATLEALGERLRDELQPETTLEQLQLDDVIALVWRLLRVARVEVALYSLSLAAPVQRALSASGEASSALGLAFAGQAPAFAILSRYETALVNRLRKSLAELERLQGLRQADDPALAALPGGRS